MAYRRAWGFILAWGFLIAGVCLLVTGCGSGSDSAATASASLTKAQYIKQANAICTTALHKRERYLVATFKKKGIAPFDASKPELEEVVPAVLAMYRQSLSKLRDVGPPARDENIVDAFMGEWEDVVEEVDANPHTIFRLPFKKANEAAVRYGLDSDCWLY